MCSHRIAWPAALAAAVLAMSGCSGQQPPEPVAEVPVTSTTAPAQVPSSTLPTPEALTGVLQRLADPQVEGVDKVALIEGAKPADAATIDKFATALNDGGYLPLNFEAAEISWSDRDPGHVTADITVTTAIPDAGTFFFPMDFTPHQGDWQLSEGTAKALLAFGNVKTGSTAPAPPPP